MSLISDATARVEELVEAADRSAAAVRLSASETLAELGETRHDLLVGELGAELVERVEALREEAHELRLILKRASGALEPGVAESPADPGRPADDRRVSQDRQPETAANLRGQEASGDRPEAPAAEKASDGPSQGLLLLATQMAVAGSDREQIAERLREDFGVVNTDEVLTQALGAPVE